MFGLRSRDDQERAAQPYPVDPAPAGDAELAPLRSEPDPDPVVEAAAARLRESFPTLLARDEWGRLVALRNVARVALSGAMIASPAERTAPRTDPAGRAPGPGLGEPSGVGWPDRA